MKKDDKVRFIMNFLLPFLMLVADISVGMCRVEVTVVLLLVNQAEKCQE